MKKKIFTVMAIIIVITFGIVISIKLFRERKPNTSINVTGTKALVVYYSAQGHTENVAKTIAKKLNADIFKIEPKEEYTSADLNYNDSNSRVTKEHNDKSLRNIELKTTKVDNWNDYDVILIGYPIWWGIAAWPVDTFVKANDFTGKIVIPFCTSASSGVGDSANLLKEEAKGGDWLPGTRFSSSATNETIKEWVTGINVKKGEK